MHYGPATGGVLALSLALDSYVLVRAVRDVAPQKPPGVSWWRFLKSHRDPFLVTIILEDAAATAGVVVAAVGIAASHYFAMPTFDAAACIGVGVLMGCSALAQASLNKKFLMGKAIDAKLEDSVRDLVAARPAVERVQGVQSRWER